MTDLPAWLSQALEPRPGSSERPYFDDDPTEVLPGDICIVEPFGHGASIGRLFVIVDAESGWCEGMLASSETELATEVDAILPSSMTGLGYPVAVHSRYSGPIWEQQVRRRVGALEMETLERLEALTWNDEADVDLMAGMPLQPEGFDPRFPALQALSAELDALTDHFRRRRYDLAAPVLDPAMADIEVLRVILTERGWEAKIAVALCDVAFQDRLLESIPKMSRDERQALRPLLENAMNAKVPQDPKPPRRADFSGHIAPVALAEALDTVTEGSVARVLSHRRCWSSTVQRSLRVGFGASEGVVVFESVSDVALAGVGR